MFQKIIIYYIFYFVYRVNAVHISDSSCCPEDFEISKNGTVCERNLELNETKPLNMVCNTTYFAFVNGTRNMTFFYREDSTLLYQYKRLQTIVDPDKFCTGWRRQSGVKKDVVVLCSTPDETVGVTFDLSFVLYLVSAPFLFLTCLVYALLPELRDLQGKIISCFCGTSFIDWLLRASFHFPYRNMNLCAAKGFSVYFLTMASFFWMNSLAIQVYRSIRYRPSREHETREFLYYSLYAWGSAAVLLLCVVIANYAPGPHYVPGIGLNTCWFYTKREQWLYLYAPLSVLLLCNCALFACAATRICRLSRPSSRIRSHAYKLWMTTRLFVLIGITWIFELASSAHGKHQLLWLITDIYNLLQGVLIFILMVVMRRRVLIAIAKRNIICCLSIHLERWLRGHPNGAEFDSIVEEHDQNTSVPLEGV